jgi:acetylornithine deacetylase/succinyl-diaminopimelate desuccinylase-like protein
MRQAIGQPADALPEESDRLMRRLLDPALTDATFDELPGEVGYILDPLLHNTVNATVVRGGPKPEVIPSEITVDIDGRLLPGFTPEELLAELRAVVGEEVEFEVRKYWPGPPEPDLGLFDTLADILREADPESIPLPFMIPVVSDARTFARLGIQIYCLPPLKLPSGLKFLRTIHGEDERIPLGALTFGTDALYQTLQRFGPT